MSENVRCTKCKRVVEPKYECGCDGNKMVTIPASDLEEAIELIDDEWSGTSSDSKGNRLLNRLRSARDGKGGGG